MQAAAAPHERLSIAGVAETHGISRNHVMKVVNGLANAGLLATVRGRGGGFTLARDPAEIRIGDVVRLTEPDIRPADCAACAFQAGCGLTPILGSAMQAFMDELDRQTLADALERSRSPFVATPPTAPAGP